jgi:hypothetical protein
VPPPKLVLAPASGCRVTAPLPAPVSICALTAIVPEVSVTLPKSAMPGTEGVSTRPSPGVAVMPTMPSTVPTTSALAPLLSINSWMPPALPSESGSFFCAATVPMLLLPVRDTASSLPPNAARTASSGVVMPPAVCVMASAELRTTRVELDTLAFRTMFAVGEMSSVVRRPMTPLPAAIGLSTWIILPAVTVTLPLLVVMPLTVALNSVSGRSGTEPMVSVCCPLGWRSV